MAAAARDIAVEVALVGDSTLDNGAWVGQDRPSLTELLAYKLADRGGTVINCALDGALIQAVPRQLDRVPPTATHLVISIGGNDALMAFGELQERGLLNPFAIIGVLRDFCSKLDNLYRQLVSQIQEKMPGQKIIMATMYRAQFHHTIANIISRIGVWRVNQVLFSIAKDFKVPIVDMVTVFGEAQDYENPIEPSVMGSDKLTSTLVKILDEHEFGTHAVYAVTEYSQGLPPDAELKAIAAGRPIPEEGAVDRKDEDQQSKEHQKFRKL